MPLPPSAGVGFKPEHFDAIRSTKPALGFLEVHAENYMGAGGLPHAQLGQLRQDYALSLHGVGLSIGGADALDADHLARLKVLCDRYQPDSFSEHLAWSSHGGDYLNDLLPLPYTDETLAQVCAHVDEGAGCAGPADAAGKPVDLRSLRTVHDPGTEFLAEVARRTGCGLLLDVNNVFVSATNHRTDARAYLAAFPLAAVGEIHLGGHAEELLPSGPLLIDAHGSPVADPVWALFAELLARTGPLPTLIEWDNDLPAWPELLAEARRAQAVLDRMAGGPLARAS